MRRDVWFLSGMFAVRHRTRSHPIYLSVGSVQPPAVRRQAVENPVAVGRGRPFTQQISLWLGYIGWRTKKSYRTMKPDVFKFLAGSAAGPTPTPPTPSPHPGGIINEPIFLGRVGCWVHGPRPSSTRDQHTLAYRGWGPTLAPSSPRPDRPV